MTSTNGDTPPKLATTDDAADIARQWSDEILQCRTYGHVWQPLRATHNRQMGYWRATRRCPRCTTERVEEISERGHIIAAWYTYPDGYLVPGSGRIAGDARGVLRLAVLTRTFDLVKQSAKQQRQDPPRSSRTRREIGLED